MIDGVLAPVVAASAAAFTVWAIRHRVDHGLSVRLGAPPGGSGPGAFRWLSGRVGNLKLARRLLGRRVVSSRLLEAGWSLTEDEVVGARVILALLGTVAGLVAPWPEKILAPLLGLAACRLPDFVCARAARHRIRRADREIPLFLDVLAAASSAGLSGHLALRRAVDATHGPLSIELSAGLRSVELGARWRDELRAVADRLDLPDLRRAVATITRAEFLGSSLTDALFGLAGEVRDARRAAASERARTAPVKMLFPLVFLVLPAFLLLTVVPVLITTLQSIR